jgi:serine/threonine protein kinase
MCALEKPFNGKKGFIELCHAIQTLEPKDIPGTYSQDLNRLIRKMLVKDPNKRPSSRALLQDPTLVQLMLNYSSQINMKE